MQNSDGATPPRHTLTEDVQALVFGTAMAGFSVSILQGLGLVTGQTAGLALVIAYLGGWSFGVVFFVINLPFYWLAWHRMGRRFTLKTLAAVAMVSVTTAWLPGQVTLDWVHPATGAIIAGMVASAGLMAIIRHGASLGGVGVLALYLQEKTGFRAGWTQLAFDAVVFALAVVVLPLSAVGYSLLGAVVLNVIIAINHRRDRYVAF